MKKKKPVWLKILLTILILGVLACLWEFISSQNPYILPVRRALKYDVLHLSPWSDRKIGIDADYIHYVDGAASADGQYVRGADNKRVYDAGDWRVLVNYLDGYQMGFPTGAEFDFSRSPLYTRVTGNGWDTVISRERATYEGSWGPSFRFCTAAACRIMSITMSCVSCKALNGRRTTASASSIWAATQTS